ncbi:hypothetical protein FACS189487_05850 [Campylobacterota bacterium]|nr:hypothetical protein FACS189487_05850 [Campylobacterota bacterium]
MGQFEQLAKIKNHKVDELRRELEKINSAIAQKESVREGLNGEFLSLKTPQTGGAADLLNFSTNKAIYRREIEAVSREIFELHRAAFQVRFRLKNALVEYEKINHLDREERAQIALAASGAEAKRLDDIAVNGRYILGRK